MWSPPPDIDDFRPWTPPDTDPESSPDLPRAAGDGDGDDDHGQDLHALSPHPRPVRPRQDDRRSLKKSSADEPRIMPSSLADSGYVEPPDDDGDEERDHDIIPQYAHLVDPYTTPVKATLPKHHVHNAMPQYPYTPDSARMPPPKYPVSPLSPVRKISWNTNVPSPVQNALSSCMVHLGNLIKTRQPDDDQMEYIIARFEDMAQYLSAPEAQSRRPDDHPFSEFDRPSGLTMSAGGQLASVDQKIKDVDVAVEYIFEVGKYIEDVSRHTEDLKMRFDEAKQLNSIQTEIITDLRRILKCQQHEMRRYKEELEAEVAEEAPEEELAVHDHGPRITLY